MSAKEGIAGFGFSVLSLVETIRLLRFWVVKPERAAVRMFVCGNPHSLELARHDFAFDGALRGADLMMPDGVGIVVASMLKRGRIRETVCGPDVFLRLSRDLNDCCPGTRVFFLGGTGEVLEQIRRKYSAEFPALIIAGTLAPPFSPEFTREEDDAIIARVNASHPDVLWIGLGAPKQEIWAYRNRHRLQVKLIGPIGAMFDFYVGRIKLPPVIFRRLGLIWLFRFIQEPRRLFKRQVNNAIFLFRVLLGHKNKM